MRATISEPAAQHFLPVRPTLLARTEVPTRPSALHPAKPDVPSWQAALATETAGPRIRRSDDELKLERDFRLIADRALTTVETMIPLNLKDVPTKPCSP